MNSKRFEDISALKDIRIELRQELGDDVIKKAHSPVPWLDKAAIVLTLCSYLSIMTVFGFANLDWYAVLALVIVQGWLVSTMSLLGHDVSVHRRNWNHPINRLTGALLFVPSTIQFSQYRVGHYRHHAYLGTVNDPEVYKQDLRTRVRKFLFLTAIGFKLASSGRWASIARTGYASMLGSSDVERSAVKLELAVLVSFLVSITLVSHLLSWKIGLFGFIIPTLVIAPLLNSLRIILEHANVDPTNKYWLATPYKTGWFTQLLFLADSGDCHLLHHVFPRVPWYRMPALVKAAQPYFESKSVTYSHSYPALIYGWFISNFAHRTKWPLSISSSSGKKKPHVPSGEHAVEAD
jgi:fatty acid desaturase